MKVESAFKGDGEQDSLPTKCFPVGTKGDVSFDGSLEGTFVGEDLEARPFFEDLEIEAAGIVYGGPPLSPSANVGEERPNLLGRGRDDSGL